MPVDFTSRIIGAMLKRSIPPETSPKKLPKATPTHKFLSPPKNINLSVDKKKGKK